MNNDIVYILKNNLDDTELIYSVRSVCCNFEYNNIWFAGGIPKNIAADYHFPIEQIGRNKWLKVLYTIKLLCECDKLSDNFWLFNDDFFIMRPLTTSLPPLIDGTINNRIKILNTKYPTQMSRYAEQLYITEQILKKHNYDTLNYALHVPMLINKTKALKTIKTFPETPMFRSLYGNQHKIGGTIIKDVKISDPNQKPTGKEYLLSTSDISFKEGRVGKYIKSQFQEKCKYET